MSNATYSITFKGDTRQDVFGLVFPEFDGTKVKMSLDIINWTSNANPLKYEIGEDWVSVAPHEGKDSACAIFKLWGTAEENKEQLQLVKKWTHDLNLDWEKYHIAYRAMIGFDEESVRTFYYRIYRNEDFECMGHPEMMLGTPQGMYHCEYCGEMQLAGFPHLPKDLNINAQVTATPEPWFAPAGMLRGTIVMPEIGEEFKALCHDAQTLDDADGRKMGDPDSE